MRARFLVLRRGAEPAELPGSKVSRPSKPASPPAAGTTIHGRAAQRRPHGLARQAGRLIGTGASAIQSVPHLGSRPSTLRFQRTPSSVDVRGNSPTDPSWASPCKRVAAGTHHKLQRARGGRPQEVDLVTRLDGLISRSPRSAERRQRPVSPEQLRLPPSRRLEKMEASGPASTPSSTTSARPRPSRPYYRQSATAVLPRDYLPLTTDRSTLVDTDGQELAASPRPA